MKNGIEKELKILVNKQNFYKLCSFYPDLEFIKQENTYYDTIHDDIAKKFGAMRIRHKNGVYIFTLKMFKNQHLFEHECNVSCNDPHVFESLEIQQLLKKYDIHGPFQRITSTITKRAMIITDNAELCFDINEYSNVIDYEIEYEYKQDHDGIKEFNKILELIQIKYEHNCDSKIKRAKDAL